MSVIDRILFGVYILRWRRVALRIICLWIEVTAGGRDMQISLQSLHASLSIGTPRCGCTYKYNVYVMYTR